MPTHETVDKRRSCKDAKGTVQGSHDVRLKPPGDRKVDADTHSDTINADHTEGLAGRRVTRQRREILERLGEVSSELAEVYEAALWLVDDYSIPARGRLLAHCARELINRLPDYLNLPVPRGQVQYVNALDRIATLWRGETSRAAGTAWVAESSTHDGSFAERAAVSISVELYRQIDELVTDHLRSRMTAQEKLRVVIQAAGQAGGGFSQGQLEPLVGQWNDVRKWFQERVHVPNTPATQNDLSECIRHFNTLEDILYAVLCPFYGPLEELDGILDETNKPAG